MTWPTTVTLDGYDLSTLGFVLETPGGWGDYMQWRERLERVTDRLDSVIVSSAQAADRLLVLRGTIHGTSRANLIANRDEIWWRLRGGGVSGTGLGYRKLAFADDTTRVFRARLAESARLPTVPPALTQLTIEAEIPLVCPDPRIYAASDTVLALSGATAINPIGSEASSPKLVSDAGTETFTYKDSGGSTIWTFGYAGVASLPVTVWLGYDGIYAALDNAGASILNDLTAGSYFAGRVFDPQHGDPYAGSPAYPTIEAANGTTVTATYAVNHG